MELAGWISVAINAALVVAAFAGKKWIAASIEKRVEHKFERQLATFNSDLRARESEIGSLRDGILGGRAQRQAMLDKRRMEAVERIWETVGKLAPFEMISASMARIDFDVAARRAPREPNLQKFFETIASRSLFDKQFGGQPKAAFAEQPFLSPLAWAYFSAYQGVLMSAYLQARVLADGVEEAGKLLKRGAVSDVLKAALPHQSKFIDENDPSTYHFLLEELKDRLLSELRNMLEGKDIDRAAIAQAQEITDALKKVDAERVASKAAEIDARMPTNGS